jgi:type VI secretion system protein ImpA
MSQQDLMDIPTAAFNVDSERLLSPIAADAPTGPSLRYEGTYDAINALRREDDPQLDQGVWQSELKKADWPRVAEICLATLETRSKDLQIAAWLSESWTHLHGFAGLRAGLHLVAVLCDAYWDGLHPEIQDDDVEFRLAPIFWIDEKLSIAAKRVPLTAPRAEEVAAYTFAEWENGCRQLRQRGDGGPTPQRFQQSALLTPTHWLARLARDLEGAAASADELHRVLDARCGTHAPALARIRETLGSILSVVTATLRGRHDSPDVPDAAASGEGEAAATPLDNASRDTSAIRSRVDAYRRLAEAAEFLERTEPHSPVPHLIRRAVSWGGLSLEELLPELVRDSHQLAEIFRTLQLGEKPRP